MQSTRQLGHKLVTDNEKGATWKDYAQDIYIYIYRLIDCSFDRTSDASDRCQDHLVAFGKYLNSTLQESNVD